MYLFRKTVCLLFAIVYLGVRSFAQDCTLPPGVPSATMQCSSAPLICNLFDYCGVLPQNDEFQDLNVAGCPLFQALNNPHLFSFIATSAESILTIQYSKCQILFNSPGIQIVILATCPLGGGLLDVVPWTCYSVCNNIEGTATIGSNLFVPGKEYWVLLDGCAGNSCEYRIVNTVGVDFPTMEAETIDSADLTGSSSLVCPGQTITVELNKPVRANFYTWNDPFLGEFNSASSNISISIPDQTPDGIYTVCLVDAGNSCEESLSKYGYSGDACFTFQVEKIPETEIGPIQLCLGDSYVRDGKFFSPVDTGFLTVSYNLTSFRGCDSLINITFDVKKIDNEVILTDSMLIAIQSDAVYQWFNCENEDFPVEGATAQTFTPESSGSYRVRIVTDYCNAYSECIEIILLNNEIHLLNNPTFFYPNPARESLHFELNTKARIMIHDIHGRVLVDNEFHSGKQSLEVSDLISGTYFAKVYLQDKVIVQKIILQR